MIFDSMMTGCNVFVSEYSVISVRGHLPSVATSPAGYHCCVTLETDSSICKRY